jgi:hypothetical protein
LGRIAGILRRGVGSVLWVGEEIGWILFEGVVLELGRVVAAGVGDVTHGARIGTWLASGAWGPRQFVG